MCVRQIRLCVISAMPKIKISPSWWIMMHMIIIFARSRVADLVQRIFLIDTRISHHGMCTPLQPKVVRSCPRKLSDFYLLPNFNFAMQKGALCWRY